MPLLKMLPHPLYSSHRSRSDTPINLRRFYTPTEGWNISPIIINSQKFPLRKAVAHGGDKDREEAKKSKQGKSLLTSDRGKSSGEKVLRTKYLKERVLQETKVQPWYI